MVDRTLPQVPLTEALAPVGCREGETGMTQTTTQINGCDAVLKIDNAAGNLADISGSSNSISIERLNQVGDGVRTFGSRFKVRAACGKDANISVKILYTADGAEALALLNDWYENHNEDSRSLRLDMPDSDPGSDRYDFEVFIESFRFDVEAGNSDPILCEVAFKPTGTFTCAEIGS